MLSRSSAEAEYRGVANVVAETAWIRNLLCELHTPLFTATLIYYDNVSAVYMSANPIQHQRTKHIEIDIHFVHDFVAKGEVRVLHVPSRFQKFPPISSCLHFRDGIRESVSHLPILTDSIIMILVLSSLAEVRLRHGELITIFGAVKPSLDERLTLWLSCSRICDALAVQRSAKVQIQLPQGSIPSGNQFLLQRQGSETVSALAT
ncbi:ribonuclease H-like domain-containing protein, partial [Tanacetum coccineum]